MKLQSARIVSVTLGCALLALALPEGQAQSHQSSSSSSSSSVQHVRKSSSAADAALDPGSVGNGIYRNKSLGFSVRIPPGWVLRTEEMNARDEDADGSEGRNTDPGGQSGATNTSNESEPPRTRSDTKDKQTSVPSGRVLLAEF